MTLFEEFDIGRRMKRKLRAEGQNFTSLYVQGRSSSLRASRRRNIERQRLFCNVIYGKATQSLATILNLDAVVTQVAGFSKAPEPECERERQATNERMFFVVDLSSVQASCRAYKDGVRCR